LSRVVVEIRPGPGGAGLEFTLAESADNIPGGFELQHLPLDPADPVFEQFRQGQVPTNQVGERIANALLAHPGVGQALQIALATGPEDPRPVYIRVNPDSERIPWETLFANGTFLALDSRWPIGRIGGQTGTGSPRAREFEPPLRVMAFLAAATVDATPEWNALWTALQQAPFPVQISVFAAQKELLDALVGLNSNKLSCEFVTDRNAFLRNMAMVKPHILHFFCHGSVDDQFPQLRLATLSTFDSPGDEGELILEPRDVAGALVGTERPWLTILNSCYGAAQAEAAGASSFVHSLVAEGLPAAVGMSEAVADTDAHLFSEAFYGQLVTLLGKYHTAGGDWPIDWGSALHEARRQLCDTHSAPNPCSMGALQNREWTMPVLYIRPEPFVVRSGGPQPGVAPSRSAETLGVEVELDVLRNLLEQNLGIPEAHATRIRARVAELEAALLAGTGGGG
jgi:hypothetical protein